MKFDREKGQWPTSEGKLLQILPFLDTASGTPFMLPPTIYQVPNWLLGFNDDHPIGRPQTLHIPSIVAINGSNSNNPAMLSFMATILEDSPSANVHPETVDRAWVDEIVNAIKEGRK